MLCLLETLYYSLRREKNHILPGDHILPLTVDGFIFVGTNFRGWNENDTFVVFKVRGRSIFLHNSYRKLLIRGYWNSWIGPSMKTTKIGTPRKLSHPQYFYFTVIYSILLKLIIFFSDNICLSFFLSKSFKEMTKIYFSKWITMTY